MTEKNTLMIQVLEASLKLKNIYKSCYSARIIDEVKNISGILYNLSQRLLHTFDTTYLKSFSLVIKQVEMMIDELAVYILTEVIS